MTFVERIMNTGIRKFLRQAVFRLKSRSLFEDAITEIRALEGRGDGGIIVFTSYHANAMKRGLLEFASSASDGGARHCLFVTDRRQGWFQGAAFSANLLRVISNYVAHHRLNQLMTVGVSMGGYGAISYAAEIGADRALAFAPQYCPRPETFPGDSRWSEARGRITEFSRPSLNTSMRPETDYTLLHGRANPEDMQHWQAFAQGPGIDHYLAESRQHDVIDPLRSAGVLYSVVDAAWTKDKTQMRRLMKQISAVPRKFGEYAEKLDNNCAPYAQVSTGIATK